MFFVLRICNLHFKVPNNKRRALNGNNVVMVRPVEAGGRRRYKDDVFIIGKRSLEAHG